MENKDKKTIKEMPKSERPREKLIAKGAVNLKDSELLAILFRAGYKGKNVLEIADSVLEKYTKKKLLQLKYEDLIKIKGIDSAKACTLLAAFELTKRALEIQDNNLPIISSQEEVIAQLTEIRHAKKEHFVALYLNVRSQLIHKETISIGTLDTSLMPPREIYEPALKHFAAFVIVAHNHPSGDSTPSDSDKEITRQLKEAGRLLDIELKDHVIITPKGSYSFKEHDLL